MWGLARSCFMRREGSSRADGGHGLAGHCPLFGPRLALAGQSRRKPLSGGEFGWAAHLLKDKRRNILDEDQREHKSRMEQKPRFIATLLFDPFDVGSSIICEAEFPSVGIVHPPIAERELG
ncbi:hypothetical protein Tco_1123230 [Tanacetum coccineum]|uniref:Uncharacterized protein n=1 Tax=Tanacetum coccineum TaxID=301880 RepID=A0ABQ5J4F8_9ASTR